MSAYSLWADDGPPQRLTRILDGLCNALASRAGRDRAIAPLILLLWAYLRRVAARFASLANRNGQSRRPAPIARPTTARSRLHRLPRGFAWLLRLAPETAAFGSQLRHLLGQPEMADLMAVTPQAGRILRPLCRMLGIIPGPDLPALLFPPPRPTRTPAPSSHVLERSAVPPPAPERATPLLDSAS